MDADLLRSSFDALRPRADELARDFYATLFATYPQLQPLFAHVDPAEQRAKLMASVATVVAHADRPETLEPVLAEMGARHVGYGVTPAMYGPVTHTLLGALARAAGDAWSAELASAWLAALELVSERMIAGERRVA